VVAKSRVVTVVLHVVTRTNIGGVSNYLENLINNWNNSNFSHVIVRGTPIISEGDYFVTHPVNAQILDIESLQRSVNPLKEIRALLQIVRVIRVVKPTIVHTHMAKAGVIGRLAAWICRTPIRIHTFHGHLLQGYFSPPVVWLIVRIERLFQHITSWSITNGENVRQDLIQHRVIGVESSSNIPPGVPLPTVCASPTDQRYHQAQRTVPTAGFVGRLAAVKRPDRFIECARALPQYNFVMFGDGPLSKQVKLATKDLLNLRLAGWVSDTTTIYRDIDVLVLTSDNEAAAVVLIEAAMAGIPVVAMNVGAVSEVVVDQETGYLANSEHELIVALDHLLNNPDLRHRLGSKARSHARENFTTSRLVQSHDELYTRLLTP
jgi:glycosyltransferase involved in cell wall biosynthesis